MKKKLLVLVLILFAFTSHQAYAQFKYAIGVAGTNEQKTGASGTQLRMYFNFVENLKLSLDYVYYLESQEKEFSQTISYDYRELNLNLSYLILFGEVKRFAIYPFMGFNYTYGRKDVITLTSQSESFQERAGLNFGFGASYQWGRFLPYMESRSIVSINSYLIFSAGIAYSFGKSPSTH